MTWCHFLWNHAKIGNLPAVQTTFAEGQASPCDVNLHGSNSLVYAVGYTSPEIVRFLIQQGADPNVPNEAGRTAAGLFWEHSFAGRSGSQSVSIVGSLLEDSDYVQTRGFSPVHKIVLGIVCKDLRSELELSIVKIDTGDSRGRAPLCWAVIRDDEKAIGTLLAYGANRNARDDLGVTPLYFVKNTGACKALLDAGVDVHVRNACYGHSALHQHAAQPGTLKLLIFWYELVLMWMYETLVGKLL